MWVRTFLIILHAPIFQRPGEQVSTRNELNWRFSLFMPGSRYCQYQQLLAHSSQAWNAIIRTKALDPILIVPHLH